MFFVLKLSVYRYTLTPPPHLFAVPPETKGCGGNPTEATPGREKSGSEIDKREAECGTFGPCAETSARIAGEQGDPQPRPKPATRAAPVEPLRDPAVGPCGVLHLSSRSIAFRSTRTDSVSTRRLVVGGTFQLQRATLLYRLFIWFDCINWTWSVSVPTANACFRPETASEGTFPSVST